MRCRNMLARLSRTVRIQLTIFTVVAVVAMSVMAFVYMRLPSEWGIRQYRVTLQLPVSGSLYQGSRVTYRGSDVGKVTDVHLTDTGVEADLSLKSNVPIPSDLDAEVHSQTAIGEQYVALLPRSATAV